MKGCVWRHPSRWSGLLLWLLLLPLCCTAETAAGERGGELSGLSAEDRSNLLCLRSAYPQIRAVESGPDGIWLRLEGERRVLYASAAELAAHPYDDATLLVETGEHALGEEDHILLGKAEEVMRLEM